MFSSVLLFAGHPRRTWEENRERAVKGIRYEISKKKMHVIASTDSDSRLMKVMQCPEQLRADMLHGFSAYVRIETDLKLSKVMSVPILLYGC
jgi:hypothetical protein